MKPKPFEIIVEFTPQSTKTGITYEVNQKEPLIRCKDCVWFDEKVPCCRLHSRAVFKKEKQFCSWAEQKGEQ